MALRFELRAAEAGDVAAIAHLWFQGWRDGHLGHVSDDLAAARTEASCTPRTAERARPFYERRGWRDGGPFTYDADSDAGPPVLLAAVGDG
jgi:hypothetical protein